MTYPAEDEETYPYTVEFNHPTEADILSKFNWMRGILILREAGKEIIKAGGVVN